MFKGPGARVEGINLNKPLYRQLRIDGTADSETKTNASVALKVSDELQ